MNLKTKRIKEIKIQKKQRKEEILTASINVFKEKSIRSAKMTDIAQAAEVGVATVYRYFKTKFSLVIESMNWMCDEKMSVMFESFIGENYKNLNGLDQMAIILNLFVHLYEEYPYFLTLLEQFDNYIVDEDINFDQLVNYEKNIANLKQTAFMAMDKGKDDGSIRNDLDNNIFYTTISHSLISLSQKLILRGSILKSDTEIKSNSQLTLLIEMAVNYMRIQTI